MEASEYGAATRKERRKITKKEKRKKKRKEMAEIARLEEESWLNDPDEQLRLQAEEEKEKERVENERREFEERERKILEAWAKKRAIEEEEEERRRIVREEQFKINQVGYGNEAEADEDSWEYVEEGPPEIIWQGNEIIVKKKKVRVKKKDLGNQTLKEDPNRPTSNPLPPQSEAFSDYKNASILSAQQLLDNVAQQTPNFGTEQDKAHCPFHLKTGACRFGSRCSRIHFYPDTSCTFLVKNMYNGPGLAWEQDEGLEYTDEEVEHFYEEFYEDVHTEFLKFGEIVNFKVCRNGSSHLRGNVYVHYKTLESAVLAYHSVNGRYFGGKLLQCEFVSVTRWKVAICGEYMKSKLTTCSRGITCNFIHCFRNPGGDYEWADWDKPPPKYWVKKMAALFGYSDESGHGKEVERESSSSRRNSSRILADDPDRYQSRRSRSRETDFSRSSRNYSDYDAQRSKHQQLQRRSADRKQQEVGEIKYDKTLSSSDGDSDRDWLDRDRDRERRYDSSKKTYAYSNLSGDDGDNYVHHGHLRKRTRHREERSAIQDRGGDAGSRGDWLGEDSEKIVKRSSKGMNSSQHNKLSRSPNDLEGRSRIYASDLIGDLSDSEADRAHGFKKKSLRSYNCEESEDEKSWTQNAQNFKDSVSQDYLEREDEEVTQESRNASNCGQSHKSSDSNSRCNSRKDIVKSGCGKSEKLLIPDYINKSKRKRDGDKNFDARRRTNYHDGKKLHHTNHRVDEDVDKRGRWEPDKLVSAEKM